MEKPCERCGKKFSCGASTGHCWCMAENPPPELAKDLREKYKDCLCEKCFRELSQKVDISRDSF